MIKRLIFSGLDARPSNQWSKKFTREDFKK